MVIHNQIVMNHFKKVSEQTEQAATPTSSMSEQQEKNCDELSKTF